MMYGMSKKLEGATFSDAVGEVKAALRQEGFGVLSEIDVKSTLSDKLDVDFRPYVILGACNPILAHEALEAEPHIGLLLPCNVVIQSAPPRGVVVSVVDPAAVFSLVTNPSIRSVVDAVGVRLERVLDALG